MTNTLFPIKLLFNDIPSNLLENLDIVLNNLYFDPDYKYYDLNIFGLDAEIQLYIKGKAEVKVPFLSGIKVIIGTEDDEYIDFIVGFTTNPVPTASLKLAFSIVFDKYIIPYKYNTETKQWLKPEETSYIIPVRSTIKITKLGDIDFIEPNIIKSDIKPFMISNTGFIVNLIENVDSIVTLIGSDDIVGTQTVPTGATGVLLPSAEIHYIKTDEKDETKKGTEAFPIITVKDCFIGSGGLSTDLILGQKEDTFTIKEENLEKPVPIVEEKEGNFIGTDSEKPKNYDFLGFPLYIWNIKGSIRSSLPTFFKIIAVAKLPMTKTWSKVTVSLGGSDAAFMLDVGSANDAGLISLDNEYFEIKADNLTYRIGDDGVNYVDVAGSIKPKFDFVDFPIFHVDKLTVSSAGDFDIESGWLEIPEAFTIDFHGFKINITQWGMGTSDADEQGINTRQWMGFSGELKLVDDLPPNASVEGLIFSWDKENPADISKFDISLSGIQVDLTIPNAIKIKGAVSYKKIEEGSDYFEGSGDLFIGSVVLEIIPAKLKLSGELIVGNLTDLNERKFTAFYIVLDVDLPVPIALAGTGLSLYSVRGLYGMHVMPNRGALESLQSWYEWYKTPERGVTKAEKWMPQYGHYAYGAGITLKTSTDDGYSLSLYALFALLIPGPVVMMEGKLSFLQTEKKEGTKDDVVEKEKGDFYAFVIFDGNAGTLDINIDIEYSLVKVIEVHGGMEALFDFHNSTGWFVHIGKKEPESKRIMASILSIIDANSYLMIDPFSIQMGAFIGIDWDKEYGPVKVVIIGRFSYGAGIFWNPLQVEGSICIYGELAITLWRVGFGLTLELGLIAKAPAPYYIHGVAKVSLNFPWPVPDYKFGLSFTWEDKALPAPVEPFLKGASILHHKAPDNRISWNLLNIEKNDNIDWNNAPILPVDGRIVLSFARPVSSIEKNSNTHFSQNFTLTKADKIGDAEFEYKVVNVKLYKDDVLIQDGLNKKKSTDKFFAIDDLSFTNGYTAQEPQIELWRNQTGDTQPQSILEQKIDDTPICTTLEDEFHCISWNKILNKYQKDKSFTYQGVLFTFIPPEMMGKTDKKTSFSIETYTINKSYIDCLYLDGYMEITFEQPVSNLTFELCIKNLKLYEVIIEVKEIDGVVPELKDIELLDYTLNIKKRVKKIILYMHIKEENKYDYKQIMGISGMCYTIINKKSFLAQSDKKSNLENNHLILEPDSNYKLEVYTEICVDNKCKKQISDFFVFRTDKGPSLILKTQEQYTKDIFPHKDTPVHDFNSYIDYTSPKHGSVSFYTDYDFVIAFNEYYISDLYNTDLLFRVRDRNKKIVIPKTVILKTKEDYLENDLPLINQAVLTYKYLKDNVDCRSSDEEYKQPLLSNPMQNLEKNRMYTAEIYVHSTSKPLTAIQFTTSRYKTIEEHLTSGLYDEGNQVVRSSTEVIDLAIKKDLLVDLKNKLQQQRKTLKKEDSILKKSAYIDRSRKLLDEIDIESSKIFQTIYKNISQFNIRKLPPKVEITQFNIDNSSNYLLLLESPEPLDWHRIDLSINYKEKRLEDKITKSNIIDTIKENENHINRDLFDHTESLRDIFDDFTHKNFDGIDIEEHHITDEPLSKSVDRLNDIIVDTTHNDTSEDNIDNANYIKFTPFIIWNNDKTRAFILTDNYSGFETNEYSFIFNYYGGKYIELPKIIRLKNIIDANVTNYIKIE